MHVTCKHSSISAFIYLCTHIMNTHWMRITIFFSFPLHSRTRIHKNAHMYRVQNAFDVQSHACLDSWVRGRAPSHQLSKWLVKKKSGSLYNFGYQCVVHEYLQSYIPSRSLFLLPPHRSLSLFLFFSRDPHTKQKKKNVGC